MSSDFWWGMFCIPAVIAAVAIAVVGIAGLIYASAKLDLGIYKLWPRNTSPELAAATIANAKTRRYFWIPGFHVFVCRTTLFRAGDNYEARDRHRRVQWAVRDALRANNTT